LRLVCHVYHYDRMFRVFNVVWATLFVALLFSGCADSNQPRPGDTIIGNPIGPNENFISEGVYESETSYGGPAGEPFISAGESFGSAGESIDTVGGPSWNNPDVLETRDMGSFNSSSSSGNSSGTLGAEASGAGQEAIESVFFGFDSSSVPAEERSKVEAAADYLRSNPSARLIAEGHTDAIGTSEYNNALADRRAQSVKEYLVTLGIEGRRIEILALGEIEADQSAPKGSERAREDRRVDLIVVN